MMENEDEEIYWCQSTYRSDTCLVIGTYDQNGKPNVMTAAWGGICCSKPPCVAIAVQKIRYTYTNLEVHNAFTICVPSVQHLKEVDYFGIASGKKTDKFAASGLTPTKSNIVDAPYVEEFPLAWSAN